MTCRIFKNHASDYLDGVLEKTEHLKFKNHLKECPPCEREVGALKKIQSLIHRLGQTDVPEDFMAGVREKLKAIPQKTRHLAWWPLALPQPTFKVALTGALALLVLLVPIYRVTFSAEMRLRSIEKEIDKAVHPQSQDAYIAGLLWEFKIPARVIETLNARNRGWGRMTIELAMARELAKTQPQNYRVLGEALAQIERLRSEGKSWRKIARELNFDLASAIQTSQDVLTNFQTRPSQPVEKPSEAVLEFGRETKEMVSKETRVEETVGKAEEMGHKAEEAVAEAEGAARQTRDEAAEAKETSREARDGAHTARSEAQETAKKARAAAKEAQREVRETAKEAQSEAKAIAKESRETVKEAVQEAKEAKVETRETVKESQEAVKETAREVKEIAQEAQNQAKETTREIRQTAQDVIGEAKDVRETVDLDDLTR